MVNVAKVGTGVVNAIKVGAKKTGKKVSKKSNLFDLASEKLLPGVKKHHLFTKTGELADEGVALVHMTDYFPKTGSILTDRAAFFGTRNSVHMAVNHAVGDTNMGLSSWVDKKFGIIVPFKKALECNPKGKFQAGLTCDLWTDGSLKLPKGTIIVRQSRRVPKGKLRVQNAEQIKRFKHLKGIKIVETPELPHSIISTILEKFGYQPITTPSDSLGGFGASGKKLLEEMKIWNKFSKRHGIIPAIHSLTPNAALENFIEILKSEQLDPFKLLIEKDGKKIFDFKTHFLDYIKSLKEVSFRSQLPITTFDVDVLENIIKNANNFADIRKRICTKLQLKSIVNNNKQFGALAKRSKKMPMSQRSLAEHFYALEIMHNPDSINNSHIRLNFPDKDTLSTSMFPTIKMESPIDTLVFDDSIMYGKKQYKNFIEKEFEKYKKEWGIDPLLGKTLVFV